MTLTEFVWERMGEEYDALSNRSMPRAILFALRRLATVNVPRLQRRYAAKFAEHPDYREEWKS